ncbi:3-keto-disaccharide hydrolase [Lacipirellula sp.]|uniref:3-keto-disaccharide hydrolase n=1 Tax=Lacipirellula sp. TaxID=2691419 RepID=UPI003D0FF6FA
MCRPQTRCDASATSLFNGKDLSGWVVEGADRDGQGNSVWRVKDGIIECQGHGIGYLRHATKHNDFVLSLEYRSAPGTNSGVGFRHRSFTGELDTRVSLTGFELQLLDDYGTPPSVNSSGALYRYVAPKRNAIKRPMEWNALLIECCGEHVRATLNGVLIQDVQQASFREIQRKPLSGYISLQNHGGNASFRNIHLRELK